MTSLTDAIWAISEAGGKYLEGSNASRVTHLNSDLLGSDETQTDIGYYSILSRRFDKSRTKEWFNKWGEFHKILEKHPTHAEWDVLIRKYKLGDELQKIWDFDPQVYVGVFGEDVGGKIADYKAVQNGEAESHIELHNKRYRPGFEKYFREHPEECPPGMNAEQACDSLFADRLDGPELAKYIDRVYGRRTS